MLMWHVYLLRCADASIYVGTTTDLARRIREHNAGKGGAYTRGRRPVRLMYHEARPNRSAAQRREAELKRWPRARKQTLMRRDRVWHQTTAAVARRKT